VSDDVYIVGVGMTPFAKHRERSIEELGQEAVLAALRDAGIDKADVDEVFCGSGYGGPLIGQRVLRDLAMTGPPVTNVENACSSSASAVREGITAIRAGRASVVLVLGVDKLTAFGGGALPLGESDLEAGQGMVLPALYAMRAQRYLEESGARPEHLALVSVKAHANGELNPLARFRNRVTVDEVLESRMIADPLTLFMCCPSCDGAAAVVLAANPTGESRRAIRLVASALQSGQYKTGFRDLGVSDLSRRTARLAYEEAGLRAVDVDLAEVHDAFASAELMYYEALGFCEPGEAKDLIEAGETSRDGTIPVNTGGGLLCRGHPVGPTGAAQICEVVWQLRGEAGPRQVQRAKIGLTHCTGGGISGLDHGACAVHILAAA
jgi:acetyl-CoA acetyltransferase